MSRAFCGIDWAENHHDVAVVDADGTVLARRRIGDDVAGLTEVLALLAELGDSCDEPIPIAIETSKGLLVACLRAADRRVFAINPLSVSRYRDRHGVSRKKSDQGDAAILANILRTDMAAHRPLPDDSELAQAIQVLARAQQDAVWDRTQMHNKLRSLLREYFPALIAAFSTLRGGLLRPEARALLAAAPTPQRAARLTVTQLRALLRRSGRSRGVDQEAVRLQKILRGAWMQQLSLVEQAMGQRATALLHQLDAACLAADELAQAAEKAFEQHPDSLIIASFPGLGQLTGARVLAEIGDDRHRFTDARALKAYAGSAPVTRASGKSSFVMTRRVKNQRLAHAGYLWAFSALTHSAGARAHYDRRRAAGDGHAAAQRNLFNRFVGMLHHCLQHGATFDERRAFTAAQPTAA